MERRSALRVMAAAAFTGVQGCALPFMRRADEAAATYEIPGRAVDWLRRNASRGYGCWQGGSLVASGGTGGVFPALSITKSVAALTTARAVTKGWFQLDDAVDFPEWRGRATVSVRQLLNLNAGLPAGDHKLYSARPLDKGQAALRLQPEQSPGRVFRYGPASWEVLGEFLKRRLPEHGTSMPKFLTETLDALGIRPKNWRRDGCGMPYLSTGMECNLSDLGHLGNALANLAAGRDQVGVTVEAFKNLTSPCPPNAMFSAGIWWNRQAHLLGAHAVEPEHVLSGVRPSIYWRGACFLPTARAEWFALVGSGGSRVYVLPAASVVIATARAGDRWSDAAMMRELSFC